MVSNYLVCYGDLKNIQLIHVQEAALYERCCKSLSQTKVNWIKPVMSSRIRVSRVELDSRVDVWFRCEWSNDRSSANRDGLFLAKTNHTKDYLILKDSKKKIRKHNVLFLKISSETLFCFVYIYKCIIINQLIQSCRSVLLYLFLITFIYEFTGSIVLILFKRAIWTVSKSQGRQLKLD